MLIASLLILGFIEFIAVLSPGPDFFMVVRSALKYGKYSAILVAAGITTGSAIHATMVVFFLDLLHDTFMVIVHWISLFGALYLLYIAYTAYRHAHAITIERQLPIHNTPYRKLFRDGLLCNLSNPKCIIFLLSILPLFVIKSDSLWYHLALIFIIVIITFIWFSLVGLLISHDKIRHFFTTKIMMIEYSFAVILLLFSGALLYAFFSGNAM